MKKILLFLCLVLSQPLFAASPEKVDYYAFCFHDVRADVYGDLDGDPGAVNTRHLIGYFQWLKDNGYSVISLQDIIDAKNGDKPLPQKAVYLTFDDGYSSFYTQIYPLLKLFNYPATFALVTDWIENPEPIQYGEQLFSSEKFLSWKQIVEMQDSGLVEIASHTDNLHHGIKANKQGNQQPAASSRLFSDGHYESDLEYQKRISKDLSRSYQLIRKNTGRAPRAIVWPYGSYSTHLWQIAQDAGFTESLVLEEGANRLQQEQHIARYLITDNPSVSDFSAYFSPSSYKFPERVMHIDLDYVFDQDKKQQARNLDSLVERVKSMEISSVYLQAFSDPDGDGNAQALYFPNKYLPVREDLFNRVAWQLKTRAEVKVFAWMPILAFDLGDAFYQEHGIKSYQENTVKVSNNNYKRLSIFSPKAKQVIGEIYQALARHSHFDGILFHDDGFLTDSEDLSQYALDYYRNKGLVFNSIQELMSEQNSEQWSEIKTQALIGFTDFLLTEMHQYSSKLLTARNIYSRPILDKESRSWFAQDLKKFSDAYDHVAIMAMPYMEQASSAKAFFEQLMASIQKETINPDKLIFELQSKDWAQQENIDSKTLKQQMLLLQQNGYINYGYYPDDFINNHPDLKTIKSAFSLNSFPKEAN